MLRRIYQTWQDIFLNYVRHLCICLMHSTLFFIWMNKPKSNIHSCYMNKYNVKLSWLTDMNCEYMFSQKISLYQVTSRHFSSSRYTEHDTFKYIHLIASCESICHVYTSWLCLLPNSAIIYLTKVCIHHIIPIILCSKNMTCNCFKNVR